MKILVNSKLSEHRYKTPEGYLVCVDSVLARTGKQTYRRDELFHDNDATEIEVDRPENEVFSEQTLASFENKPLTIEHPEEDVNPHNHRAYAVGFVRDIKRGTDNGEPVMLGTLVVTDEDAIKDIEDGKLPELSCGYDCDIADDDNPQQRNIRGNHVALCEHGRAGNARIVDSVNDDKKLPAKVKNEIRRFLNHKSTFIKNRDYDISEFVQEFERMTRLWAEFPLKITRESIRGWNKMGDGMMRKDYVFSIDGYDEKIIVSLYAKPDTYETTELNTYFLDSTTKSVDNMNTQEKGAKGLEKQVAKLVEDNAKDILADLLAKYGFKIVRDGKTWTGRTHIEFTGDYFDEDNRWSIFDKARQKIDRLEAEAKRAGIRMTFNLGTAGNNIVGTIDAEQIHDSIKDEFDYEYAKHFRALEQDVKDMYRQWKQYGNKTPSDILTAKGYKDGYGDTMTKKIDNYEYVVDFDDIGYVKYYVRKDNKIPAGWTITKMTFTDCDIKDSSVYAVKARYEGTVLEWYARANSEQEAFEKVKRQPGHNFDKFVSAKIVNPKSGMHIIDGPDLDTTSGKKQYFTQIAMSALDVIPTNKWNMNGNKINIDNNRITLVITDDGIFWKNYPDTQRDMKFTNKAALQQAFDRHRAHDSKKIGKIIGAMKKLKSQK